MRQPRALTVMLGLLLAAGVMIMHTVGHPDSAHSQMPASTSQLVVAAPVAGHAISDATVIVGDGMSGMTMDPMLMCLAVLFTATVLALLALARIRRGRAGRSASRCNAYGRGHRRGPPRQPHGLILANLAVMRN